MNLVGINLYCYILEKEFNNINNFTKKYVKTGFGGAGNRGSCCINFSPLSTFPNSFSKSLKNKILSTSIIFSYPRKVPWF